jgi:hypothetical protein
LKVTILVEGCNSSMGLVSEAFGHILKLVCHATRTKPHQWAAEGLEMKRESDTRWWASYDTGNPKSKMPERRAKHGR